MAHTHPVVDSDSRFVINSTTRAISTSSDKLELIQGDHKSERITFEIPKIVEGHDMSLSDRIEVHYINIDRRTKATSRDVYIADDMAVDGDKLTFSWLISGNATKYYGRLNFIILFECLDPDGNYTYKWNTEICKLLTIGEGISNTEAVAEDYSDILEKFKIEVLGEATKDTVKFTEQELSDEEKTQARDNIGAMDKCNGMTPVECTLAWGSNTRKQTIYVKNGIMKPLDYSTAEGDLKNAIFLFGFLIQGTSISPEMADMYTKAIATLIENGVFGDDFYKTATYPNNMRTLCLSQFSASLKVSLYSYDPNDESKKIFVMMVDTPNGNRITRSYNSISKTFNNVYIDYTSEPLALTAAKDTDTPSLQQVEMAAAPTSDMQIANKKYVDDSTVQSNYGVNDMTLPSYIKNRLFYHKAPMTIAEIPPNAENYVVYACIDNLDNKSLTFTVKEKDTQTILETGFTFNANTNTPYRSNNFRIDPITVFDDDHYDEFGRSKMLFTNHTDKALIFMSDEYYAKIPELYLPKAGWDSSKFLPGLMTANKYNPSNANRYSSLLVDNNGHLYTHERMRVLNAFTLKYSDVSSSSFYNEAQILVAISKGNMSHFFKDLDDVNSYPVIIIPGDTCTFYFSDGQVYKGDLEFTDNSPDTKPSSITGLTKIGGNYYSSAQGWAEIKKLQSTSNDTYDSIGLISGETYKVTYSQADSPYEAQIEAAENASLGMIAVSDPGGRWTVGDTKSVINSMWVSNGLGSLGSIYKKSVNKVIPVDAIIDADKLGSPFIVTMTIDVDIGQISTDKTSSEIYDAYHRGLPIYLFDSQNKRTNAELIYCTPDQVIFALKRYTIDFPVVTKVIPVSISGDTVDIDSPDEEINNNPLFIPPATAEKGDVWGIKSDGTTGWVGPSKDFAPIEMEYNTIETKVYSASSLVMVNSSDVSTFMKFAKGIDNVMLNIPGSSTKFTLTPGGSSGGEFYLLYNGSIAATINNMGSSANIIHMNPSVLGITLTVGARMRFSSLLPKLSSDYIPNYLATKTYVDSQISAEKDVIIKSSTEGSSKKFKITVDDAGTISATEVAQ